MREKASQMPFVVRSDSENEAELVFLSPDEEVAGPQKSGQGNQGASPVLRRSNRKRKSVTAYSEADMSKGSSSKKKKSSPSKDMPKVTRTPPKEGQAAQAEQVPGAYDIGALLKGMEERLAGKIEATNKVACEAVTLAKTTKDCFDALEEKVESCLLYTSPSPRDS